jgi:hypothetical protein
MVILPPSCLPSVALCPGGRQPAGSPHGACRRPRRCKARGRAASSKRHGVRRPPTHEQQAALQQPAGQQVIFHPPPKILSGSVLDTTGPPLPHCATYRVLTVHTSLQTLDTATSHARTAATRLMASPSLVALSIAGPSLLHRAAPHLRDPVSRQLRPH